MAFYQGLNNTIYMFGSLIKDRINSSPYTLFILVFLIGLLVRIIFPELKLLHHDEAIHAWLTYDLITKGTYLYDPMYHGPLLYYLTGAAFSSSMIQISSPAFSRPFSVQASSRSSFSCTGGDG